MPSNVFPTDRRFTCAAPRDASMRWPNGAGLAISFVLNIEEGAERPRTASDDRNESAHEVNHEIQGVPDYCMQTHFEYGARAGDQCVVKRFVERRLPLTLNVCGRALESSSWVGEDARQHGFEMCGHGWRWESPPQMDEATERASLAGTAGTIERLSGRAPVGWHCKSSACTPGSSAARRASAGSMPCCADPCGQKPFTGKTLRPCP